MENTNKCPCCPHHCDRDNLQCGKGEAYFRGEFTPDQEGSTDKHHCCQGKKQHGHGCEGHGKHHHEHGCEGHGKHHHEHGCGGHGHKHHRPEFPAGSLADLMAKCGHRLFHGGEKAMFDVLNEQEMDTLKKLLEKLLSA